MQEIVDDFGHATWLPFSVIAARLALATVLGAIVGFEREWRQHSAGLRTHMLVSLAAATFAILGIEIVHSAQFEENSSRLDPIRVIEAVTAGVAFLAAGSIIFSRGKVKGLTTGAGLWLAGAIGLSAGLGLWQVAVFATVLALIVLGLLHSFEKRVSPDEKDEPPVGTDRSQAGRGSGPAGHT
jgi:putative Mg2+ transporter-C (MgtC) family protein